jgi:hypothetical protein
MRDPSTPARVVTLRRAALSVGEDVARGREVGGRRQE